jgi:CRISPR-associated protein Cmx8
MSQKTKRQRASSSPIELTWHLHELPSPQYSAGLVGLYLMIRHLGERAKGTCTVVKCTATSLTVSFDRVGLTSLLALTYKSVKIQISSKTKPTFDGSKFKTKKQPDGTKVYLREDVVPDGAWLKDYEEGQAPWIKLWRDFLWRIPFASPKSRYIYTQTAARELAGEIWDELASDRRVALIGPLMLGSSESTHEGVGVNERARNVFPLRFWPYVCSVYVPMVQKYESKMNSVVPRSLGYAVAIPDVLDIKRFAGAWQAMLRARQANRYGFLPAGAVVSVPQEAAFLLELSLLEQVHARNWSKRYELFDFIAGVEVYHCDKPGRAAKFYGVQHIAPTQHQLRSYSGVIQEYRDYGLRAQRVLNMLRDQPWVSGMAEVIARMTNKERSAKRVTLQHDLRLALEKEKDDGMARSTLEITQDLVSSYVAAKARDRARPSKPGTEDYQKVREELFFATRDKTSQEFLEWFCRTIARYPVFARNLAEVQQMLDDLRLQSYVILCTQLVLLDRKKKESESELAPDAEIAE